MLATVEQCRPEFVQALSTARWIATSILLLGPPAILVPVFVVAFRRLGCVGWLLVFLGAVIGCWLTVCVTSEMYWSTMDRMAETEAEQAFRCADTARTFGPLLFGVPFALCYSSLWLAVAAAVLWVRRRIVPTPRMDLVRPLANHSVR
jgi:hypothetical protein